MCQGNADLANLSGRQRFLPTLTTTLHRLEDAADQGAAQPWATIECQQLLPGRYEGSIGVVDMGGIRVVREFQNTTIYKICNLPDNLCTLSIVEEIDPALRFSQFGHEAGHNVFFLPTATDCDILISGGTATLYVALDQERLFSEVRQLNPERWERGLDRIAVIGADRRANFASAMASVFDLVSAHLGKGVVADIARLERTVLGTTALTLDGFDHNGQYSDLLHRPSGPRIARTMRNAHTYIQDCLARDDLPTVADMCAHAGVSERTLQYSFRDQLDMTPVAYLRVMRLNQARLDLSFPARRDLTVTEVAMRWGFLHLGRFAQAYRALFHETPSQTLDRQIGLSA